MEQKHFKYTIYVNQYAIIRHKLKMDLYDGAIFGMLKDFATCDGIQTLTQGGFIWYKFKWQIIPRQLPVLPIKGRTAVYNRMQNLCNAGMLISHPENQKNRESWYRFGPNSSKYSVHFGEHDVHDGEHKNGKNSQKDPIKVHNGEHYVHDGEQSSVHVGEHSSVHNGEHDNTTINNTTINNIDISKKIEGILPCIPQDWPKALKSAVVEYLAYRQELPKKDQITSQRSWNAKTKSFTKLLAKHGEKDTVGAILLSIENAWKKVSMEWYLKEKPDIENRNTNGLDHITQPEAKKVLTMLYTKHPDKWITKYTNKAQTDYIEALNLFYKDHPQLKPDVTTT